MKALVCYIRYSSTFEKDDTEYREWEITDLSFDDYIEQHQDLLVMYYEEI